MILFLILSGRLSIAWKDLGLKVVAATADGASPNRRFFQLHTDPGTEYKTLYPFATFYLLLFGPSPLTKDDMELLGR